MKRYVRPISLRPTRDEFAISSRVLGTLHWRHAAYNDAATTPSIDRPRIRFLFTAFRYTIAAVSRTFLGSPIPLAIRSSSLRANARFRSVALLTRIRRCHFRSRYSCARFRVGIDFPYESLFFHPIVVESPLSWIVYVIGAPVRARFSPCSTSNARHSGPWSIIWSVSTSPHSSQISSPRSLSNERWPELHSGHLVTSSASSIFLVGMVSLSNEHIDSDHG